MYRVSAFEITDVDELHGLISSLAFGHLVTTSDEGFIASAIPLTLDPTVGELGVLRGHVARGNPQWRGIKTDAEALVIYAGAHGYISPSYYASVVDDPRAVPTWDYVTVNVHGRLSIHDDPAWVEGAVGELTEQLEQGRATPWSVTSAPSDYINSMIKAIVGVELAITKIEGKAKLSQNRPRVDQRSVIDALSKGTGLEHELAREIADVADIADQG